MANTPFRVGQCIKTHCQQIPKACHPSAEHQRPYCNKMSVLYHLAAQREALVILFQETHCTSVQRLVLLDYQLAGFSVSRKHALAMFVHEQLKWTLFDQSPPTLEIEWLCFDVDGYKIASIYKSPPICLQVSHNSVSMLVTLIASMLIGVIMPTVQMENAWFAVQVPTVLPYVITQKMPQASTLTAGI